MRADGNPRTRSIWLLVTGLMTVALQPAHADDLRGELKRFLYDEAMATFHIRSYFLDSQNPTHPNFVAQVVGGWVGLQTGWFYDTFQLGAVGYTTQPIWAPQDSSNTSNGTLLLKPDGYGFFTLGQAYVSARWQGQTFTGFRQYVDELEVNPHDNRELPQTFEAYALRGKLGAVNYFAGYVAAQKPRDFSAFINMGEAAGAPNYNRGMALGSVKYGSMDNLQLRASTYYVPDILWSSYSDAGGTIPISEDFKVQLSGQFAVQGSNGLNLLTGQPFSTFWAGGRATPRPAAQRPGARPTAFGLATQSSRSWISTGQVKGHTKPARPTTSKGPACPDLFSSHRPHTAPTPSIPPAAEPSPRIGSTISTCSFGRTSCRCPTG